MDKNIDFFEKFTSNYNMDEWGIKMKYDHSYRVMSYSKQIAESLDLDSKETDRATEIGLFHDLGRFPQYAEYKTFTDSKSIDHGDKSEEILKENGYNDDILLKAVKYHNKYAVPEEFDDLTKLHCNLVRDADKIDILIMQGLEVKNHNYDDLSLYIPYFKEHKLVPNDIDQGEAFGILRMVSYLFDINYKYSIEILIKKDILNKKMELLRNDKNSDQIDILENEVKKFIKERFDIKC